MPVDPRAGGARGGALPVLAPDPERRTPRPVGGPPNPPFSPPASRTGPHHTVRTTVVQLVGLATVAVGGALAASLGGLWWGALAAAIAVDLGLVSLVVPPVPQQSRRRYHPPRS